MKTNIVIPMKAPNFSKTRLRHYFSNAQREKLALKMFESSLAFFKTHFSEHHLLVVTSSALIARIAESYGATVLIENVPGLNQAASSAAVWSVNNGFNSQLLIPADIAQLDVTEITTMLTAKRAYPSVLLAPADDMGTNALLTTPPNVIEFSYGVNSSVKHEQQANVNAINFQSFDLPHLSLDVDMPSDIEQLAHTANPLLKDLAPQWT